MVDGRHKSCAWSCVHFGDETAFDILGKLWLSQRHSNLNSALPACISIIIYRLVTSLITGVFCKENAERQAVKWEAEEFDYVYFSLWNFSALVA